MDTSETYINMCERAELIQVQWSISEGDWYIDTVTFPSQRILTIAGGCPSFDDYERRHLKECQRRSFWLPRQDQLQDMIKTIFAWEKLNQFNCWFDEEVLTRGILQFDNSSFEQLWLAFVMKEKYNKTWNGKGWND